jgi:hypothetical protein
MEEDFCTLALLWKEKIEMMSHTVPYRLHNGDGVLALILRLKDDFKNEADPIVKIGESDFRCPYCGNSGCFDEWIAWRVPFETKRHKEGFWGGRWLNFCKNKLYSGKHYLMETEYDFEKIIRSFVTGDCFCCKRKSEKIERDVVICPTVILTEGGVEFGLKHPKLTIEDVPKEYIIKGKKIDLSIYCNQCGMQESLFLKPEDQICRKLGLDKIAAEAPDDRNTIVNLTLISDDEFIDAVKKGSIKLNAEGDEAKGRLADISIIDGDYDSYKKDNIQIGHMRSFKEAGNINIHSIVMSLFVAVINGDLGAKSTFRKFAETMLLRAPK